MNATTARKALRQIRQAVETFDEVTATESSREDPYRVLISCILSQRTKEEVTIAASERLFAVASTPSEVASLDEETIASLIFPVGFWRTKARRIRELSRLLIERHAGAVPATIDPLLALPGVGRKTATLVLSVGFGIPAICVDTHVHRISNRLGLVSTSSPEETERALEAVLPRDLWIDINSLLVLFGRTICTPVSPRCSVCPVAQLCERVGVSRSR